ncbi:MAG: hypothetical protein JWN56_2500 [Sphingobacteriales bacterium]|nr:hypothetical protein [Sphingobacteriales bacterium]
MLFHYIISSGQMIALTQRNSGGIEFAHMSGAVIASIAEMTFGFT